MHITIRRYGEKNRGRNGQPLSDQQRRQALLLEQYELLVYGRRVGYCSTKLGTRVAFLRPQDCQLTSEEKQEVQRFADDYRERKAADAGRDPGD